MVIGCDLCDSASTQLIRVVKLYISVLYYIPLLGDPAVILHKVVVYVHHVMYQGRSTETLTAQGG